MSENYTSGIKKVRRFSCSACLIREILAEFGHVNGIVLDVGCGSGYPTKMLEKRCNHIVGIDISYASNNILFAFNKSNLSPFLSFCSGDAIKLPFKDECFDAVVSFDVIEHVEDDLNFLLEIKRVMKKGAKLLLETPNVNRLSNKLKGIVRPIEYPLVVGDSCIHIREYSKSGLENLMKDVGFRDVKIKGVWLGLRGGFEVGMRKIPQRLEKYSQCWLVEALI
jgi:SAM-dependent methyltransferase